MEQQNTKDEVTFKVGRNVLRFQKMELLLKYLVANGSISGYHSELKSKHDKKAKSVSKQTLGMLTGKFLDNIPPGPAPEDLREPHLSFNMTFDISAEKKEKIEALVQERNHLVHHLLQDIDTDSPESWRQVGDSLDEQCERLDRQISDLNSLVRSSVELRKAAAEHINSKEFKEQFLQNE